MAVHCLFLCLLFPCSILAAGPPAVITVQPLDQTVINGGTATFTVTATSGTTLSYQWYKDGFLIFNELLAGQTSTNLALSNVGDSDVGQYFVQVRNAGGTVTSPKASLTVFLNSPPVANNDIYSTPEEVALVIPAAGVLTNDTDVNGHALTALLVTNVSQGSLSLNTNGSFTYTPNSNYFGSDSFTYRASDGYPVILEENNSGGGNKDIKDGEKGAQSFRHGTAGEANYTISKIILYLSRKSGGSGNLNFSIGTGVNSGGIAGSSRSISTSSITNTSEGSTFQTYAIVYGAPLGPFTAGTTYYLNLNNQTSERVYVAYPAGNTYAKGSYYDDGSSQTRDMRFQIYKNATSNPATVTINVTPVNDAPVANNDSYTTLEGVPLTVSAPGTLLNDTDVDGDVLTALLVRNVSNGSLGLDTDGSFTYTPNTSGTITTNTVTVIVTNNPGTDPSTAVASTFGTISSAAGVGTVTDRFVVGTNFHGLTYAGEDHGYAATKFYSLHHDQGANTNFFDTLAPTGVKGTITDRFTLTQNNFDALTYASPDLGYGPIIFYYLRHDADGRSIFGSITPGGVVGVVADHKVVGTNFVALTFSATDVGYGANLFYYVRRDTNCNSIFGTIDPAQGGPVTDRFSIGAHVDALVFTSTDAGYGANNFYYLRHDASGVSTFGTIFVTGLTNGTVTDRFTVGTNVTELTFTPTDVLYGPNLFYYLRGTPKPGCSRITFTTNIVTTFTTNTNFNGSDSFTYRAADGSSTGNVATVTINVTAVNHPPLAVNDTYTTLEDVALTIPAAGILTNDADVDGDALTALLVSNVTHGSLSLGANGGFTYTPNPNYFGSDSFTYRAHDGTTTGNVATVTINLTPVNDPPIAGNDSTNTLEDVSVTIKVLTNNSDVDGDALTLTGTSTTNGTAVISGPNIVFTPSANFNGVVVFSYTVSDGALSATASVIVTVTPVNDIPLSLDSAELTAAGFGFQFSGAAGSIYVIEATTNMTDWVPIFTNSSLTGQVAFTDTTAASHRSRFYRVMAR